MAKVIEEGKNVRVKFKDGNEGDYKGLGKAVLAMRKNRSVSQSTLSNKTNRDRTGLSNYECGKTIPTLYALHEISEVLDYDMEVTFKEVPILNRNIITKEYVEKFISERNKKYTLSNAVFSRIEAVDEECNISEINKNDITISLESGKSIRIKVNGNYDNLDNIRFIPIFIEAIHTVDGNKVHCMFHYSLDSKENGLTQTQAQEVIAYIHDCVLLGDLISINDELDDILIDRMDIHKLKASLLNSYTLLKMDYKLKDEEILELAYELYDEDTHNFFIGMLKSSYEPLQTFNDKKYELIDKLEEICEQKDIELGEDSIYSLFRIAYCIKFKNKAFWLYEKGSDYSMGSYICNEEVDEMDNNWGNSIVEPYILENIDTCFKELSETYTDESSFSIIEWLVISSDTSSYEYDEIESYIDSYIEEYGLA